jgi:Raf kinase inhibitor-like YbhB/YbcL family protein
MRYRMYLFPGIILAALVIACGCTTTSLHPASDESATPPIPEQLTTLPDSQAAGFSLHVDTVGAGALIPVEYTCAGAGISPGISWENPPQAAKSFVLILEDPDAPYGTFTHWIMYNIPPTLHGLTPAQPTVQTLTGGAVQGGSSAKTIGYFSPCPPPGKPHRYVFRLYALDTVITPASNERSSVEAAMGGHVIGEVSVTGVYGR